MNVWECHQKRQLHWDISFGDMIQKKEQVPVGIINISKGEPEAWMSEEALADYPEFLEVKERFAQDGYIENLLSAQDKRKYMA